MREGTVISRYSLALAAFGLALGLGCAGILAQPTAYQYFGTPDSDDAWSSKIAGWQRRERADGVNDPAEAPPVAGRGDVVAEQDPPVEALRSKYFGFRAERKRATAREFTDWVQSEAKRHYIADGPIDHWATLEETLRRDGDDCDGLELLVYHGLRDLGFSEQEVYRAVVYRPSDGQHHMVTLWFEDREDPWVIDPTGAMSEGMQRMSSLASWVPLKVFSENTEFTVRRTRRFDAVSSLAVTP